MPHRDSPPMAPIIVAKVSEGMPPADDVNSLSDVVFNSKTSQPSLDASYALTDLVVKSVGAEALQIYGIVDTIRKATHDKKNGGRREGAMFLLGAMFEKFPVENPASEALFLVQSPDLFMSSLDALADKGPAIREGAQYALDALYKNLKPEAVAVALLPLLISYLEKSTGKWQGSCAAYQIIGRMAEQAKMGHGNKIEEQEKDILREAIGKRLERLIPVVELGMHDVKSEVSKEALKAMSALMTVIQNDDVEPRMPLLLSSMKDPSAESLQKAIHALSQTTFVAEVTSPVLALVTPLLERSLNTPTTSQEVLRQTVIVVENLTRLVHDPREARAFLPRLEPGVKKVKDRASLPEVREIARSALNVIEKAMRDPEGFGSRRLVARLSSTDIKQILDQKIKSITGSTTPAVHVGMWDCVRLYTSEMIAEAVNQRHIDRVKLLLAPYLGYFVDSVQASEVALNVRKHYSDIDAANFGAPIENDPSEVVIVDASFSLGYGGRLLLSHANLRLVKGRRYALCGRNGVGKTTLMRSIAEEKLEGFPPQSEVKTCFVEHNQGEDANLSILEYVCQDPRFATKSKEHISSVLETIGFDAGPNGRQSHKVGSLSGGWKMKLALARALLLDADVLLLDEPTNHLDQENVQWVIRYLKSHTEITSLIVSHDSTFLDEVCTDVYHYEGKKLVLYPGNLSEFVNRRPEAKSYYTLSSTSLHFKLPAPGILSGVKSQTRSILRMTDCSFTYPNAVIPSIVNASCQLSLSSRVSIVGANGAGKSTLIKILTGEVVPQQGIVEKHPNLRIGYIKQHSLEHVEMHLEKTPNQYLQWRYENGDDREVHMKQTRVMTPEEKAQMAKHIRLGPGVEGRIEALLGRQKYKKSFQYEVKWVGKLPKHNTMVSRETLQELGFHKLVQEFDDHEASREGLGYRILEPKVIAEHFQSLGLDPEVANHTQISGLSGGQKVKVVIAGAMWNNPHILIGDELTNFVDRETMGALAVAIRDFRGGVCLISHNHEFLSALCTEEWHVSAGRLESKVHLAVDHSRFEDMGSSTPRSLASTSAMNSNAGSATGSAVNSEAEGGGDMKFRARKKKKMTRAQLKEREVRRRLRHIDWLNSPKGTPKPPDTDDEAD